MKSKMLLWCTGRMGKYGWPKQLMTEKKLGSAEGTAQKYKGYKERLSVERSVFTY
jgi:hypothetical protein